MADIASGSLLWGTWEIVSRSQRLSDGRVIEPWGAHPAGRLTYDADGHVTALLMHERRNEANGRASPPDIQAAFTAYCGTYTVDVTRQMVTHTVTASLSAARASGDLQRHYELRDGALILTFTRMRDGVPVTNIHVFKRISTRPH